ncbi:AAA family ATPase [Variovorax ureilyticus]|uniref:AAA family ATPase n=1 Tax=Variovorax ureilyticus TaxID=1836198 RepID=A0ABU8VR10_9BURK
MRIEELNLVAYGKFTDYRLALPQATHDFHVIIGPNEAGKSTIRRAITELLFGMEMRSPLGFKHAQSDLKLSGVLATEAGKLAFVRTKQHKSLRSLSDDSLPESYLGPVLGSLTQETFEQLHCLDHERLLKGGQGIVDPRNSVSQILFQAASGLEGFAAVREALGDRAGQLFTNRGRNSEYAKAADRFTDAQKRLKDVQVRTKEWVEARDALKVADDNLEAERRNRRELELQRTSWDRARRLAPLVERLARVREELTEMGETTPFPPSARETLDAGIAEMNSAAAKLQTREEDVARSRQNFDAIEVEGTVLERAADIERLAKLCGLYANHGRDLLLRRGEVDNWLKEVLVRSSDFGWGESEEEVRNRLPKDRVLRAIGALLKTRGALLADERAAKQSEEERQIAVDDLKEQLDASAAEETVDPQLVEALEHALPYKTSESKQKVLQSTMNLAQTTARNALAALGRQEFTQESLRSMQLPSPERVTALRNRRQELAQAADVARSLAKQSEATAADLELEIAQFERSRKVVTVAQVSGARHERDEKWGAIKAGTVSLAAGASQFDVAIRLADELSDARTLSETDAAELQALHDQLEKSKSEKSRHDNTVKEEEKELAQFDAQWAEDAASIGLQGMDLDDLPEWVARREAALQAADDAAKKTHDYDLERDNAAQARRALSDAMLKAKLAVSESTGLAALCATADEQIRGAQLASTRRQDLEHRLQVAHTALRAAKKTKDSKTTAVEQWNADWKEARSSANLSGVGEDVAEVESAVAAAEFIRQRLEKVTSHRTERIQTMEADLGQLKEAADSLAPALAPDWMQSAPEELSRILNARLEEAKGQSSRRKQARTHLDEVERQLDDAKSELTQAKRSLDPLLKVAHVDDPMLALPLVERWRRKTDAEATLAATRADLEKGSDGLSLEEIRAEVASHPAADAAGKVMTLRDQLLDSDTRLTTLLEAQLAANKAFDVINGGDQAAVAEAQKQEALAEMSDSGEEYLQLATAGSLLRWAVDRYRDRKQGPLLQRASAVFENLTRGSFEKLRIDYDQNPPALLAYRPNSQSVKVSGLSDGTRDQLFLALRIAALELQTEQGAPVPFIADDLFINFDDKRSQAGLQALYALSTKTQVIFLSHQEHLLPVIRNLFSHVNVRILENEEALV